MGDTKSIGIAYRDQDIDGGTIGATNPTTGRFTTLSATALSSTSVSGVTVASTGDLYVKSATVAAAGANQGAATQLAGGFTLVTAADDAKGVKLPAAVAGRIVIVKNGVANKILKIYPATDDKINGGTATTGSYDIAGGTSTILVAYDAVDWYSIPLVAS